MSYPNIFLVIALAQMLDIDMIGQLATWFLVPMFTLVTVDEVLCSKLRCGTEDARLLSFLKVQLPIGSRYQPDET
jgi:hypothetical protein